MCSWIKSIRYLCRGCYLKELGKLLRAELKRLPVAVLFLILSVGLIVWPFPGIKTGVFDVEDPVFASQLDEMYFEFGVLVVVIMGVLVVWGYIETVIAVRNAIRRVEGNMGGGSARYAGDRDT